MKHCLRNRPFLTRFLSSTGKHPSDLQHLHSMRIVMRLQIKLVVIGCCVLSGCDRQPAVTQATVVGKYVYKSEDPEGKATDHDLDRLTLNADGKYDLVQGGATKARSEKTGLWHFSSGDRPEVLLDHSGYPVKIGGNEVKLLIDDDLGIWYSKTK